MIRFLKEFFCAMSCGHEWEPDLTESPVKLERFRNSYEDNVYNYICVHCNAVNLTADRVRERKEKREEARKNAFALVKREREKTKR